MKRSSMTRVFILLMAALCAALLLGSTAVAAGPGDTTTTGASVDTSGVLYGKTALFCGDSICAGSTLEPVEKRAWAGRIGLEYGTISTNAGRAAASVALSTDIGKGRSPDNRIITQIEAAKGNPYDYVILHGGINDAMSLIPVGVMTDSSDVADFDITTFAGALEELFARAQEYFGDTAQIGYIVNYQTPMSEWGGATQDWSEYIAVALQICDKWNITYLDLYNDEEFNQDVLKVSTKEYLPDYLHPNAAGYDILTPKIGDWMETLGQEDSGTLPWVIGGVGLAVVVVAGGTTGLLLIRRKKKSEQAA